MANIQNKIKKNAWKRSEMASLLAASLIKGDISPLDHELRDHAIHLFKRKYVYGTAKPRRKVWSVEGKFVRHFSHSAILLRAEGKYILAPVCKGGGRVPKGGSIVR